MRRLSRSSLLLVSLLLGACAGFPGWSGSPPPITRTPPDFSQRVPLDPIPANQFVLISADERVIGVPQIVFTRAENTFSDLAREYGLGYDELVDANPGIDPWLPGENTAVLLPTQYILPDAPLHGVVLNIASKRLFYFPEAVDGEPQTVFTYPIGIGRVGWETPLGETRVVAKAVDPSWYVPASVRREHAAAGDPLPAIVPPGPDNPLGNRVLKLGLPGYLIHGTNQPYGVGMRVSHGCVRLYPENIETLFTMVGVDEPVMLVNQPILTAWLNGEFYLEGHEALEDDTVALDEHLQQLYAADQQGLFADKAEQELARAAVLNGHGVPRRIFLSDSDELLRRARLVKNTVTADPDAPTLEKIRELLDAEQQDQAKSL
jgi:L,D-transpeptidase ErfK/SrfK